MSDIEQYVFKITIFGSIAVGKTSLLLRYVKNSYSEDLKKTIGANFLIKEIDLENKNLKLILWDIAGQSKFDKIRDIYFKGSNGAIGVYDTTNPNSLAEIPSWVRAINNVVVKDIPMILIGNKIDLKRKVEKSEGESLANDLKCDYLETSAKTGANVEITFHKLAKICLDNALELQK